MKDLSKHPCFNQGVRHTFGRIHLPVAPRCNMQCNFCNRKYDCLNESHPGITSAVLTPDQALDYLHEATAGHPEIAVVGIAGPGDPFANPDETMQTLRLVRREFPHMLLCVATNGLAAGPYVQEMAELQVSHVTITINAVDPAIGKRIYAWIRDDKRPLRGETAAQALLQRQTEAVSSLKKCGIAVKVNSIIIPGINDTHIPVIAETVADLGTDLMNCMPMAQVEGSEFEDLPAPDDGMTLQIRESCRKILPQMSHCARCRADAIGLISEGSDADKLRRIQFYGGKAEAAAGEDARPFIAVASYEGALVNRHLGEAETVLIYGRSCEDPDVFELKERRATPPSGGGDDRWISLAAILNDCRALLVKAAGPSPKKIFASHGVRVIEMEGFIEDGLSAVYSNKPVPAHMKRHFLGCSEGITCRGAGTGCG